MSERGSTDGGRGDVTRRRLVEAAVKVFGENGYHGVGTRDLAEAAGANQAAIPYYFGGKEGLYRAAAEDVAAAGRDAFKPVLEKIDATALESLDREELARLVRHVFSGLTRGFVGKLGEGHRAAFIVREQLQPGPAFEVLYEGYLRGVHEAVTRLVAVSRGHGPRSARATVEAHALIGAVLGFVVARETLQQRVGWDGYTTRRVREIEDATVGLALRALGLPDTEEVRS